MRFEYWHFTTSFFSTRTCCYSIKTIHNNNTQLLFEWYNAVCHSHVCQCLLIRGGHSGRKHTCKCQCRRALPTHKHTWYLLSSYRPSSRGVWCHGLQLVPIPSCTAPDAIPWSPETIRVHLGQVYLVWQCGSESRSWVCRCARRACCRNASSVGGAIGWPVCRLWWQVSSVVHLGSCMLLLSSHTSQGPIL